MQDKDLYQRILGLSAPWQVADVALDLPKHQVVVRVDRDPGHVLACPTCGEPCSGYDSRRRSWRSLDTMQFKTILEADVPRVECREHGVLQVKVPWAESGSGFTALFEAMVISWMREANLSAVADMIGLSWDQVDGIMDRSVKRGMARREEKAIIKMGLDETSYQKHHEYVTVIMDQQRNVVVEVIDDRTKEGLGNWLKTRPKDHLNAVESVSMDMWQPYIKALLDDLPGAEGKICFDHFHVSQHFGQAVDKVRSEEHRELKLAFGSSSLTHSKHDWLRNSSKIDNRTRLDFMALTRVNLRTARAWAIKETAGGLWNYSYRGAAEREWNHLLSWISRCRLKPVMKVGEMVRKHLWGILNAIIAKATNAKGESMNSRIQKIKSMSCGFRSRTRFRRAILFHLGGLNLIPDGAFYPYIAHPKS
jgi:transposase